MKLTLKLLFVAAITCGFGRLVLWLAGACGPRSAGFAFLAVWLIMCWVALVSFTFPLRLPASYYVLRPGERDGRRYERLGVLVAKRLLRRGPLHWLNPRLHFPRVRDAQGMAKVEERMRRAETDHVYMFLVAALVICHAVVRGWWDAAGWTLLFDVVINGYPVILQRYNRARLATTRARDLVQPGRVAAAAQRDREI